MRIVMASHYFGSHRGGIEIVAEQIYRGLAARDQEVVWLASDVTPAPAAEGKCRAVPLPGSNFIEDKLGVPFPIPGFVAAKKINREVQEADVLILHDCLYLSNIIAFLAARSNGIPSIIVQHLGFLTYNNHFLNALVKLGNAIVTRPMLSSTAETVFISQTTKKFFETVRYKRAPEVVFNGVDTEVYRPRENRETSLRIRQELNLPEDRQAILFVGRFVEKKGISVMKRMAELRPDWTWVFAGWGPLDPLTWNAPNVRVFSGLQGSSLSALYRACDALVLPSVGEGFPLVIQEALASGLGVVCSDETLEADPAMKAFVRGAPIMKESDKRTAEAFVCAIENSICGLRDSRKEFERRAFAISRYSWSKAADKYLEIASRLARQASSPAFARDTSADVVSQ
jgi:glycosyltransferase involved in cell wall biosynthesis